MMYEKLIESPLCINFMIIIFFSQKKIVFLRQGIKINQTSTLCKLYAHLFFFFKWHSYNFPRSSILGMDEIYAFTTCNSYDFFIHNICWEFMTFCVFNKVWRKTYQTSILYKPYDYHVFSWNNIHITSTWLMLGMNGIYLF